MSTADTIFALSSGAPPAAIAIIRLSGTDAFEAVRKLAGRVPEPRRASLASLRHPINGDILDRALIIIFPGPDSASGEDLAELHLHGGKAVVRAVEEALSAMQGLRKAEPGEFTRRAFLNGRIDLNEAEGLADLLSAETEWQRRAANAMVGGGFSQAIETWRTELLMLSALTEAELDFSDEDDVDDQNKQDISDRCMNLHGAMTAVLAQPSAEKLKEGLRVVLGGPPNSGKSTLLNALVDRDAAIVSEIAGTTRDMIEVPVAVEGVPLLFIDTAGVRDGSHDAIEVIGIERARSAFSEADILLWLGPEGEGPIHPHLLEIEAKADEPGHPRKSANAIVISAKTGIGVPDLLKAVGMLAKTLLPPLDQFVVNSRQRKLLANASMALRDAAGSTDWLITAEQLRQARLALDALTGRAHTENMLDMLFGRFCVGK